MRMSGSGSVVDGPDPVGEPGQAAAGLDAGAAGAIVADPQPDQARTVHRFQRDMPGAGVLGRVGEQLCRAEVGDDLDRGRRALGQVEDQADREVAAGGQGGEGGTEALGQGRRMDAMGQVAELGDRLHRSAVGSVDELEAPLQAALPALSDRAAEMVPGEPQLHDDGDHLSLGPVVQVLLDTAQPRGRVVDDQRPGSFQLTNSRAALHIIQSPLPAWHQVSEPEVQCRRNEQQRSPPVPGNAEDGPQGHRGDSNEQARDRHALDMTPAKLRGDAAGDPRSWPGRWLHGLLALLAFRPSG
jgi:hypothetical protein